MFKKLKLQQIIMF